MSDYEIPNPEPKEIDGVQQLRILVGGGWWCQWWETLEVE